MKDEKYPYLFQPLDGGELVEVPMTHSEYLNRYEIGEPFKLDDGRLAHRDRDAEIERDSAPGPMISGAWRRPLHSWSLGCHSTQIPEFRQKARDAGLTGVDFDSKGRAVFTTRRQRKLYARLRGCHDGDGGYGDG